MHKRWFDTLTTFIIVSGLLTTSSYHAVYSSYALYPATPGVCRDPNVCPAPGTAEVAFRTANVIAFLMSISCIIISVVVIVSLNRVVMVDAGSGTGNRVVMADWSCALINMGYRIAITSFCMSVGAIIAAAAFCSAAFFPPGAALWTVYGFLLATVISILVCISLTGIEVESYK